MGSITITGLGAGELEQLPLGVYRLLKSTDRLFLRTADHPVVHDLTEEGISFESFDEVYETHDTFEATYRTIVDQLFSEAEASDLVYAVPGHPHVAEQTVQLLLAEQYDRKIPVSVYGGQSFLDPMFTTLQIDPVEGFQLLDATTLQRHDLQLRHHIIITQVYDAMVASDVKLTLMDVLPDDYEVTIVQAAGTTQEVVETVPLYELDRHMAMTNLTAVYVKPVNDDALLYHDFEHLRDVIATLRGPEGCPWDRKQTHESLKKYLVEETYEVLDAIDDQDDDHIADELGDVLLQVMLHAQIGEDEGFFSVDDVIRAVTAKMIRRHPHVFGNVTVEDESDVNANWEKIKAEENKGKPESSSRLDGVPRHLPGLYQAYEFQKKAAKTGFDWKVEQPIWDKIKEELEEFQQETAADEKMAEFGDVLFAVVNLGRFYKIDPEEAIRRTNRKFKRRFRYIEQTLAEQNLDIETLSLDRLDEIWEEAKKQEGKHENR